MSDCVICKNQETGDAEKVAMKRAAATAHELAMNEAEKGDKRFSFLELYGVFFSKIYKHEYKRELTMESERQQHVLRFDPKNAHTLCDYHNEFDDAFCLEVYEETKKTYSNSKWKPVS
jgi:hypothetical protein